LFGNPTRKAAPKQGWIKPVDEAAQPTLAGNAEMEFGELPQKGQMMPPKRRYRRNRRKKRLSRRSPAP
jgi:hypothetical protein